MMTQQHPPMRAEGLDDPGTFKLKVAEWPSPDQTKRFSLVVVRFNQFESI